jgi:hypothetical protein
MKHYTGIGSRDTPIDIQNIMTKLAIALSNDNWILRSGGAEGADSAFEAGATYKQIFLPWNNFNGKTADNSSYFVMPDTEVAREFVYDYHPRAMFLKRGAFSLMMRNSYQVLGANLASPSNVLFCYTSDGTIKGGTGQAMRIAKDYKIEIINLYHLNQLDDWLTKNKITLA